MAGKTLKLPPFRAMALFAESLVPGELAPGLAKKLGDPRTMYFLERLAEIPADLELDTCKECGPIGLMWASGNKDVKAGLGVLIELAKAMGRLKPQA